MELEQAKKLPEKTGVYIFQDEKGKILYVGKASNIRKRVVSYFSGSGNKETRLVQTAKEVKVVFTETVIEALIKEAELIKTHRPPYNIKENDDRSFLYVVITNEKYPRVLLKRGVNISMKDKDVRSVFGPFIYSSEIRMALKIIRKIFPYSTHKKNEVEKGKRCFYAQIGLCPGACSGEITPEKYMENIKNIEEFLKGRKKKLIRELNKKMKQLSDKQMYEEASEAKRKRDSLQFVTDTVVAREEVLSGKKEKRVEGYDISVMAGSFAVGVMVVFKNGKPQKEQYRLFKIKGERRDNDVAMLQEVLERRLKHSWDLPYLIVVDGGKGQVSALKKILKKMNLKIQVVGVAKGRDRKGQRIIGKIPPDIDQETVLAVPPEAHRFALNYHKKIRRII